MKGLQLITIIDSGNLENEKVTIKVIAQDDAGRYVLFKTKQLEPGKISAVPTEIFWLPDQPVKSGDSIVIYSKKGIETNKKNEDGSTTFFFYWKKSNAQWLEPNDIAVLVGIESLQAKIKP